MMPGAQRADVPGQPDTEQPDTEQPDTEHVEVEAAGTAVATAGESVSDSAPERVSPTSQVRRHRTARNRWLRLGRHLLIATAVLSGAVGVTGLAGWLTSRPPADVGSFDAGTSATGSPGTPASPGATAAGLPSSPPGQEELAAQQDLRPTALAVPDEHIAAPVVTSLVDRSGALEVPLDPAVVGWWAGGAAPGSATGTVVLAGHVDYNGRPGALFSLANLPLASLITVTSVDGSPHTYRVVTRRHVAKTSLAETGVFRTDGPPRLALITCGGSFDRTRHSYRDNVIVLALPA
ncbi:class F sortase [Frankia sp. R82]|uniref:class F sortase n=1 Tax=Frankia sp. R82 TaxID=2950553 RepID=UPI0020443932|nr:class F sortase [Frankia sp. R82]MCM3884045.1 class F sortase [Frankia sp. R82]